MTAPKLVPSRRDVRRCAHGRLAPLAAGLAMLALPALAAQDTFRGDAARTGASTEPAPAEFHRIKWTFPTGDRIVSSPVWDDGRIVFGSDDGNVYAVDAATGRQVWMRHTDGPVPSTPAIDHGRVFVGSYDGHLYALDAVTGALRWKFATDGERRFEAKGLHGMTPRQQTFADMYDVFLSSPLVAGGRVYFGSGDGHVYALDADSGALKWKFATGDVVHASPAYADGVVVVGSWDGNLYALDAATGQSRWVFHGGTDPLIHNQQGFQSSPAIVDGTVFVGCRDGHLYAIDAATGQARWSIDTAGSWVVGSPAVSDGRVYFATSDSALYQVADARTGALLQKESTQAYVFSSPEVAGELVLVGVLNGALQARDRRTGALRWQFRTDAARENRGWVLTADGHFNSGWLFPSSSGEGTQASARRQQDVGSFFSTPLVRGGTVYIGSADSNLYAIE